jgi:hypothetical protein
MTRTGTLSALAALALLAFGSVAFANESTDNTAQRDAQVAADYRAEAAELRDKAESHRKLAKLYASRTPIKGTGNYRSVTRHCEGLAAKYEAAAKDADAVADSFSKQ